MIRAESARVRRGLASAVAWLGAVSLVALAAAPVVRAAGDGAPAPIRVAAGLAYLTGSFVCHQRPARSFHMAGAPLAVCARCTGLYVAALAGFCLALPARGRAWRALRQPRALLLAAVPTAASIGIEWLGGPSGLPSRAIAAGPLGLVVGVLVASAVLTDRDASEVPTAPSATLPR